MGYYQPYQNQYYTQLAQSCPQAVQPPQANSGLIWIQGEQAAKSYLVAPNTTVLLMDSEASRFYLKSCDASGMPTLRVFEYKETTQAAKEPQAMDLSGFATKAELDAFRDEIQGILKNVPKQKIRKEAQGDGEPAV